MVNIADILIKYVPKCTKLYCTLCGDCYFDSFISCDNSISVKSVGTNKEGIPHYYHLDEYGRCMPFGKECLLFPSKDQRDWDIFKNFHIKRYKAENFKPFDKVLVRYGNSDTWETGLFEQISPDRKDYITMWRRYKQCIPYNEETQSLLGTTTDCPEYYKSWINM